MIHQLRVSLARCVPTAVVVVVVDVAAPRAASSLCGPPSLAAAVSPSPRHSQPPNDSLVSLRPSWLSSFLSPGPSARAPPLTSSPLRSKPAFATLPCYSAPTPATPSAAHVDHAARGDISEPG